MKRRGLTLGKFAPLHRGHQLLIETALAETDELVVIIYDCPQTTRVPLHVRAGWLRKLYPRARVVEAWDGPTEVSDTPEIKRRHEDYVIRRLGLGGFTHFYSSEFYGEHMSRALGAVNRVVDAARAAVPVSATEIRRDPFARREFLHPLVYRDLVTNIALLGAPCTGKTTLAERLAGVYETRWMPEYGRQFWEQHQVARRLTPEQLVEIAERHLEREEALLHESNRYLFADTNALTTYVFALYYHGSAPPRLEELAAQAASRYDLFFVCGDEIPYEDTWDRSGEANRAAFQRRVVADLAARKIPFFTLRGDVGERERRVGRVLARHEKYGNLLELFASLESKD